MQFIISLLTWQNLIHLIDILVIWFLIYELLMLIRGTRAVQLFRGILIIILVKIVSWYVGLSTVSWVMDQIINWGVIAIVIIFQPEACMNFTQAGTCFAAPPDSSYKRIIFRGHSSTHFPHPVHFS